MYHVELRKFPHSVCRFNQTEQQVRAIVVPWTNEEWIEEGERKWNSNEATITVLEGPKLSMPELAMGRGWRSAQRRSEDVTERVLEAVKQQRPDRAGPRDPAGAAAEGRSLESTPAAEAPADPQLLADSLALELLGLLDAAPAQLSRAWALASERRGDASAAESLALAEQSVRSLLARGLVVLQAGAEAGATQVGDGRVEAALRAVESWADGEAAALAIARRV